MTILVLSPHADDETLGMGGTIAYLTKQGKRVVTAILTGHGKEKHPIWDKSHWDIIRSECISATNILGVSELIFEELPAACLDHTPVWQINNVVKNLIVKTNPTEVYIPFAFDLHKDHRAIFYASMVATRPYLLESKNIRRVIAYETLSETHLAPPYLAPAFQPNIYQDISSTLGIKLAAMREYKSQIQEDHLPRSIKSLKSLAQLRGSHIGVQAAESFVLVGEYNR